MLVGKENEAFGERGSFDDLDEALKPIPSPQGMHARPANALGHAPHRLQPSATLRCSGRLDAKIHMSDPERDRMTDVMSRYIAHVDFVLITT